MREDDFRRQLLDLSRAIATNTPRPQADKPQAGQLSKFLAIVLVLALAAAVGYAVTGFV